jgi:4-hydroxy-tetrahydrodipicolinate reductase
MNIALIGYGKIGKMIEKTALERGHSIGTIIDVDNLDLLQPEVLGRHDAAIEFSTPDAAYDNISRCMDAGVPVVSGTTGWTSGLGALAERCRVENLSFLYASNFSLGVNIFFHLNRNLARVMNRYEQYNVRMTEVHHTQKLDAPSGTAITLAEGILEEVERKKAWVLGHPENEEDLPIEAIREGTVAGVHEVTYESEYDSLSIRHSAKDRRGFAIGAVLAAEFIHNRRGFFSMKDVLGF